MVEFETEELEDVDLSDASEILETLERVEGRLEELKEERSKLFEANQRLVELVEHLEDELSAFIEPEDVGTISVKGYEYSFKEGWRSTEEGHEARMDLDQDVDVDGVQDQINEVRQSIKNLERSGS